MMRVRFVIPAAAVLAVAASVPVWAAGSSEGLPPLTIDAIVPQVPSSAEGVPVETVEIKVSNILPPSGNGSYALIWRVLDQASLSQFAENDDAGTLDWATFISSDTPATAVFKVLVPTQDLASGHWLDVGEYRPLSIQPEMRDHVGGRVTALDQGTEVGIEVRDESMPVSLSSMPYGQLPEAPWAAALPLVGFGAWVAATRRHARG
jgi:hypothetical protein